MAITRTLPPVTVAYAELNDEGTVDVGLRLNTTLVSFAFTAAEAFHLADEIRAAATEAAELEAERVGAAIAGAVQS